jgi:predicted outer membrane repeat protein
VISLLDPIYKHLFLDEYHYYGGSIFIKDSESISIANNEFSRLGSREQRGGALEINSSRLTSLILSQNAFQSNKANTGGAVHLSIKNDSLRTQDIAINRNVFEDNHVTGDGGAIYFESFANGKINTRANIGFCNFTRNHADSAGGAIFWNYAPFERYLDVIFTNNSAGNYGSDLASSVIGLVLLDEPDTFSDLSSNFQYLSSKAEGLVLNLSNRSSHPGKNKFLFL